MPDSSNFQVYENVDELYIKYRWSRMAGIGLGFFALIWNLFLLFWYTTAIGGGAPVLFLIFPLLHVAAGIFIGHQALSMLFNHTEITVSQGQLSIEHRPIPAFKGNKYYPTADIDQFYVKQKTGSKGKKYYEFRCKMIDDKDILLISNTGMTVEKMKELEQKLERYIGITDQPVEGEYGRSASIIPNDRKLLPRQQRKSELPEAARFAYSLRPNQKVIIENETLNVTHLTQFDWTDGNTDKQLQLTDELEGERLLYLKQNKGIIRAAIEREMNILETQNIPFDVDQIPSKIEINGKIYLLEQVLEGKSFLSNIDGSAQANAWMYQSLDKQTYIRITKSERLLSWYEGTPIPLREILPTEYRTLDRTAGYDQEDFV